MNSQFFGVECVTSKSNSTIVKIAKLLNKKDRKQEQLFILDGIKLFVEAQKFDADIKYIILNESALLEEKILEKICLARDKGAVILCVNDIVFNKLTEESSPQGIITVCSFLKNHCFSTSTNAKNEEKVMVFESVRDPGNVGSILRNAAAFGIDRLVFSSDCADIYSPKVLRAAMGAIFKVKIDISSNLSNAIDDLKKQGRRVIATTLGEKSLVLGKNAISAGDVFIIGNEGHGVSDSLIDKSDETMFIPMCENTESLNASVATAILMWEIYKI